MAVVGGCRGVCGFQEGFAERNIEGERQREVHQRGGGRGAGGKGGGGKGGEQRGPCRGGHGEQICRGGAKGGAKGVAEGLKREGGGRGEQVGESC